MNSVLQYPEELIRETGKTPSICLVLPFEPQINDKDAIQARLKAMQAKAESELLQQYSNRKAIPVLARIRQLIAGVSYYNYKKSLALLATPLVSKKIYLDFPVREMVRTGEGLTVRDILMARKEQPSYLLLVLKETETLMYEGDKTRLSLIRRNAIKPLVQWKDIDSGLEILHNAYHLPVIIAGDQNLLNAFRKVSRYEEIVMAWLAVSCDALEKNDLLSVLQSVLQHWNSYKHYMLLGKLKKASGEGRLVTGMEGVGNAATHTRSQLLVLGNDLQSEYLDDIIEKVLKDEGEVELVDANLLNAYDNIALIERKEAHGHARSKAVYHQTAIQL